MKDKKFDRAKAIQDIAELIQARRDLARARGALRLIQAEVACAWQPTFTELRIRDIAKEALDLL